jgi:dimeric dUTPase (all-alpha-NTP-PPase superfamily)
MNSNVNVQEAFSSGRQNEQIKNQTGVDLEPFDNVVRLQTELNGLTNPTWRQDEQDWITAILVELGELVDSTPWKWWKNGKMDWANLEIELIDIFHFILSLHIEKDLITSSKMLIITRELDELNTGKNERKDENIQTIINHIRSQFLVALAMKQYMNMFILWLDLWKLAGKSINDLYSIYQMKYTLNVFRQNNGYKDGSYVKIWNGDEDNVVAQRLCLDIDSKDKDFVKILNTRLQTEYDTIEIEEKSLENFVEKDLKWNLFFKEVPASNRNVMIEFAEDYLKYNK